MIKGIVFDCFGVLLADVLKARIEEVDRTDPIAARTLHDIVAASNRGMISREESAKQMAEIFHIDHEEILYAADQGETKNFELMDYIRTLRPHYKVAMLSNVRGRFRLDERFGDDKLDDLFDAVLASGDIGFIKPERQAYESAAEALRLAPEECVMIDDVGQYVEGAIIAGMQTIQYVSNAQLISDLEKLLQEENE